MAWTGQSFSVGQILTAAQMQNLQDDVSAVPNGDASAPRIQTAALEQTAGSEAVTAACIRAGAVGTTEMGNLTVDGGKIKMTGVTDSTTGAVDTFTFPQGILLYAATNTGSGGTRNSKIQLHNGSTWVDVFSFADTRTGGFFDGAIPSSGGNLRILDDPAAGTHNYAYKIITN